MLNMFVAYCIIKLSFLDEYILRQYDFFVQRGDSLLTAAAKAHGGDV